MIRVLKQIMETFRKTSVSLVDWECVLSMVYLIINITA